VRAHARACVWVRVHLRRREERDASACMRRHQASALASVQVHLTVQLKRPSLVIVQLASAVAAEHAAAPLQGVAPQVEFESKV
jgi:hypothetical protein